MRMYKVLSLLLALCLLLTACGAPAETVTTTASETTTTVVTTAATTVTTTAKPTTTTTKRPTTTTAFELTTVKPTVTLPTVVTLPTMPSRTTTVSAPTTTTTTRRTASTWTTGTVGTTLYRGEGEEASQITPLLYKVTGGEGQVMWLFGSVHIGTEDMYPLPRYVMDAFASADTLAVEFDILAYEKDLPAQYAAQEVLLIPDPERTTADYLSYTTYQKAVSILRQYISDFSVLSQYMPIMWYELISSINSSVYLPLVGADPARGIDRTLLTAAYERGDMQIDSIESALSQNQMLANFSDPLQEALLRGELNNYGKAQEQAQSTQTLLDMWCEGDPVALNEQFGIAPTTSYIQKEYDNEMIIQRNSRMAEYAVGELEKGCNTFLCVGLGHIVGETGLVEQIRQNGYVVRQVIPE